MRQRKFIKPGEKVTQCPICGWDYYKREMKNAKKGLVCPECYDKQR